MTNISSSNIRQKWADNGHWTDDSTVATYAGFATKTDIRYVTRIRVTFPENAVSSQFKIAYRYTGSLASRKLKYKITTTAQDATYGAATSATPADGTVSISASSGFFTINYNSSVLSGANLYIYLWTNENNSVFTLCTIQPVASHQFTYTAGSASTLSISGNTIGSSMTLTITSDNANFRHRVIASFGTYTNTLVTSAAPGSFTWVPPLPTIAAIIPNAASITGTITIETKNGDVFLGSRNYTVTLVLPSSVVPTIDASRVTLSPVSTNPSVSSWGVYVQNYSKISATIPAAAVSGVYGSTIASTQIEYNGQVYTSLVTPVIDRIGDVTVTVTAIDSRGRRASVQKTVTYYQYIKPFISGATIFRSNASGVESETGSSLNINVACSVSPCGGHNTYTMTVTVKNLAGATVGTTTIRSSTQVVHDFGLIGTASYRATITIQDAIGESTTYMVPLMSTLTKDFVILKNHVNKAAFFKYPERDGLEIPAPVHAKQLHVGTQMNDITFSTPDGESLFEGAVWLNDGIDARSVETWSALPTSASGVRFFTVSSNITIGEVTIPHYSKGLYVSNGLDATVYCVSPNGRIYTAFRNGTTWAAMDNSCIVVKGATSTDAEVEALLDSAITSTLGYNPTGKNTVDVYIRSTNASDMAAQLQVYTNTNYASAIVHSYTGMAKLYYKSNGTWTVKSL